MLDDDGVGASLDETDASTDLVTVRVRVPVGVDVSETVEGGVHEGESDISTDDDIDQLGTGGGVSVIEGDADGSIVSVGVFETSV